MKEVYWLEDFHQTCQDIMEDTFLLEALAAYARNGIDDKCFPRVFSRLCDYLFQHTTDLLHLEKRLEK